MRRLFWVLAISIGATIALKRHFSSRTEQRAQESAVATWDDEGGAAAAS